MKNFIDLYPQKKQKLSPKDYLSLTGKEKRNIVRSKFIPPSVGSHGFGHFDVTLKNPVYTCNGETRQKKQNARRPESARATTGSIA